MNLARDLALALQYALPHRLLSALMYGAARIRLRPLKNVWIRQFARYYAIDLAAAESADPEHYPHFNAFFTRALRPEARPLEGDDGQWVLPSDGRISALGPIERGTLIQAKGLEYTLDALLAERRWAERYAQGSYLTVYLAPRDYHRVHMPCAGRLLATTHVPGRLFSVAPWTAAAIPGLYTRNERLIAHFEGHDGAFAVILVGAIFVSSIETVWSGVVTPPYAAAVTHSDFGGREAPPTLSRGAELGRFNMGSTVIVLSERRLEFAAGLEPDRPVRMGQSLGRPR